MKKIGFVFLTLVLLVQSYFIYDIQEYRKRARYAFEYNQQMLECLYEMGVTDREKTNKERQVLVDKYKHGYGIYGDDVPSCRKYIDEYRCWGLNPKNLNSVKNCGHHFGFSKRQISQAIKDGKLNDSEMPELMWDDTRKVYLDRKTGKQEI